MQKIMDSLGAAGPVLMSPNTLDYTKAGNIDRSIVQVPEVPHGNELVDKMPET